MEDFNIALQDLASHHCFLLLLCEQYFLNPLIPSHYQRLEASRLFDLPHVRTLMLQELPARLEQLKPGMYFPVPMARAMATGKPLEDSLIQQFFYDFIQVDAQQRWSLKGEPLAGRIQTFFLKHLFYEPILHRYYVQYWVDERWDLTYLQCAFTPVNALRLGVLHQTFWQAELNTGRTDFLDLKTLTLDAQERLFAQTQQHGLVRLSEAPRWQLLQSLNETGDALEIEGKLYPLQHG